MGARKVSIKQTSKYAWRISFDGMVPGDSRGYDEQGAWNAALKLVSEEAFHAEREGREPELVLDRAGRTTWNG